METLTYEEVKTLAQQNQRPSVSIYQPTHRTAPDNQQNPIRFRNLLREAERMLAESGMKARDIEALLAPAAALIEQSLFWRHVYDGLALFIAPGDFHVYRLPFPVEEQVVIAPSYYLKPILAQFTNNGHYFILAFSQNEVRLLEGTRFGVGEINLPESVPGSLEEAIGEYEAPPTGIMARASGGGGAAVFYGGAGDEQRKIRVGQFLNRLDASLRPIFLEQHAPVVLAGVDYLMPIYRKESDYPHIMAEGVPGNPDLLRPEALHAEAWPIVAPYFSKATDAVFEQYQQLATTGQATDDLAEVVAAAWFGRVDKLVIAVDADVWGRFDPETGAVTHFQGRQDSADDLALLDFAAMQTIARGGVVYALPQDEMPTYSPVLAVLRY